MYVLHMAYIHSTKALFTLLSCRPQGSGRKKEGPLDAIKITEKYPALRKEGEHTAIEMLQPNSPTEG